MLVPVTEAEIAGASNLHFFSRFTLVWTGEAESDVKFMHQVQKLRRNDDVKSWCSQVTDCCFSSN